MTYPSRRGRVLPPDLDDRTWQDLVDELKELIPTYAPQWTDRSPGDLGTSLIELFAWLVEGLIYRLNRTPEKHYLTFLNLLGVTRNPPTPAKTYLTFTADGSASTTVSAGCQFQTEASEAQTPVIFETDEDIEVSPFRLRRALVFEDAPDALMVRSYIDRSAVLVGPPTGTHQFVINPESDLHLCLGFDAKPPVPASGSTITVRFVLYQPVDASSALTIAVQTPVDSGAPQTDPAQWPQTNWTSSWRNEPFQRDGTIEMPIPRQWATQRPSAPVPDPASDTPTWTNVTAWGVAVTEGLRWIGIRLSTAADQPVTVGVDRILFNSVAAHNALSGRAYELVGTSNGEPFQVFPLDNYPLYTPRGARTPAPDLIVEVATRRIDQVDPGGGDADWEQWSLADELPDDKGKCYRCDSVTGEISFGDYDATTGKGHGSVPPAGHQIRARYRYVAGGTNGNIRPGTVRFFGTTIDGAQIKGVAEVTNLGEGFDGSDEEPVDDTIRRAPDLLKTHDRAVTGQDYENLARVATTDVYIARCLTPAVHDKDGEGVPVRDAEGKPVKNAAGEIVNEPAFRVGDPHSYGGIVRAPGTVHVIIVPDQGTEVPRPTPNPAVLAEVHDYLDQRRDLTAALRVHGPRYLPITVTVDLDVWSSALNRQDLRDDTNRKIDQYLHPTRGGSDGTGWQLGQPVFVADLFRAIMPDERIAYITKIAIQPVNPPLYHDSGPHGDIEWSNTERPFPLPDAGSSSVRVADYELVCAADEHTITFPDR